MNNILNIEGEPIFDDRIVKIETYNPTYNPYGNTMFEHRDEIRISIYNNKIYTRYHLRILSTSKKD